MLPKNKLAYKMLDKLKVYSGDKHPHQAQNPQPKELAIKSTVDAKIRPRDSRPKHAIQHATFISNPTSSQGGEKRQRPTISGNRPPQDLGGPRVALRAGMARSRSTTVRWTNTSPAIKTAAMCWPRW